MLFVAKLYWKIYAAVVLTIDGFLGIVANFAGDQLKEKVGDYWPVIFLLPVPLCFAHAVYTLLSRTRVEDWEVLINHYVEDVKIYGRVEELPQINIIGEVELDRKVKSAASRRSYKTNDLHAVTSNEPLVFQSPVVIPARTLDFAALNILRESSDHEYILSAQVVVVCPQRRCIVIHHRSRLSETYKDCLHTIGGAFNPAVDGKSLLRTAHREVYEEIGASVLVNDVPPMILCQELRTRFLQLVFLGAKISGKECDKLESNWEAEGIIKLKFDELQAWLLDRVQPAYANRRIDWVPTGKAHVLAWLAHGAPGAGAYPRFGKLDPKTLFLQTVRSERAKA